MMLVLMANTSKAQNDGISSGFLIELNRITEFTINTGNNAIKTIILKIFL